MNLSGFRYDDVSGRKWLNADPAGLAGGIDLYAYVGNNPINSVDPYGLWSFEIYGGVILGGYFNIGYNKGHLSYTVGGGLGEGLAFSYDPEDKAPDPSSVSQGAYQKGILAKADASAFGTGIGVSAGFTKNIDGCGHRTKTVHRASVSGSIAGYQKTLTGEETYLPGSDDPEMSHDVSKLQGTKPNLPETLSKIEFKMGGFAGGTFGRP